MLGAQPTDKADGLVDMGRSRRGMIFHIIPAVKKPPGGGSYSFSRKSFSPRIDMLFQSLPS
jgi:hypothetical protein